MATLDANLLVDRNELTESDQSILKTLRINRHDAEPTDRIEASGAAKTKVQPARTKYLWWQRFA
ncbi:hypothetical protein Pse7367_3847 (plasmid) [Thalassoporum mexicanum PCC 7367]|uniref:hypothetical protein n=1 Tax=Thalassoporum mexicanum TaxID=3457544 RepID=UPI00029FB15E|nr:hypothetical protein [Pseudanabaena sp. PCC 7367]AFY72070.1 hypothetical protein Pse7367_3847 [Pseudanabaena sp. PCC 7367]